MNKSQKQYFLNYLDRFNNILDVSTNQISTFLKIYKILLKYKNKNTVHIFGNGGSASIASHFSMDLTNNSKIKCISYNDASIITCYSNDFGYENWISRALEKYGKKNDLLILISSSGKSKNVINAVKTARLKKFFKVISFTGFNKSNTLGKKADLNFWINSNEYNF